MLIDNFAQLIQPVTTSDFFSKYWEQRPLIISRHKPNYYSNLFSKENIDEVIYFSKPQRPLIQLYKNGQEIACDYDSEDREKDSVVEIYNEYYQGSTLILRGVHRCWKSISNLCRSIESTLTHPTHVNMYLTPKNSQAFKTHFDSHEVFVLQVEGSKVWRIYDTFHHFPLPIEQQKISKEKLGKPLHEIVLEAGDMLYIPSGYVHEALTSECSSLHLTLGITVYRWLDLLSTALNLVGEQNVSLRKALPVGFFKHGNNIESLKYRFEELLQIFSNSAKIDTAVEQLTERVIQEMSTSPDGHFTQVDKIDSIGLNTLVQKRKGAVCHVVEEEEAVAIQFPGNKVIGPKCIESALRFIASSENYFTVGSLPNSLSDNSKSILVRRLVREGLLATVNNEKETASNF